ncbi:MAG: glycine cleavage system protein GcvH [Cyanophyceae cyanobacterium]
MAFTFPDDLVFQDSHEYVRVDGDVALVGLSAYAIDELGDLVFLELPEVDSEIEKGENFGSLESVKAVGELYSPVTGVVIECNDAYVDAPENLAADPHGENGWLIKVRMSNPEELEALMSAGAYRELLGL